MPATRLHPKVVVRIASPNFSRRIHPIRLIVIHDTEGHNYQGVSDLRAVGHLFANPGLKASAHVCTDGEGQSARFVPDRYSAWECCVYNSWGVGIEQVGFASQRYWPDAQIKETARWVARFSKLHGIPIQRGRVSGGGVIRPGVVTHQQLGSIGCGHSDPGSGYPFHLMMRHARSFRARL